MIIEKSEFKGKPVLVLKRDENDKFPFTFGVAKAKLILETIDEIKKFVAENEKEQK
jgi:CO dehydrogenase nickel-insertion accessory protein CooC1